MSEFETTHPDHPAETRSAVSLIATILVRLVIPAYIIAGAVMKFMDGTPDSLPLWLQQMVIGWADEFTADASLFTALRAIIAVELVAAGVMLFIGRLAKPVAIVMLAAFLFVQIGEISYLMRGGESLGDALMTSCGCFGTDSPPMYIDLAINLALLTAVLFTSPRSGSLTGTPKWGVAGGALWVVVAIAFATSASFPDAARSEEWKKQQPIFWKGKHFNETLLPEYVGYTPDDYGPVAQTWVLYRANCDTCKNLFNQQFSDPMMTDIVVAVNVPDPLMRASPGEVNCPMCEFIEIKEGVEWRIGVPVILKIDESGIITDVVDVKFEEYSKTSQEI